MAPNNPLVNPGRVEQCIAAIANAYEGLKIQNGYRFTVVQVYRHPIPEDSLDELEVPAIFVVRPEQSVGIIQWQDERAYLETLRIDVVGMFRGGGENPEEEQLATKAEAFLSDLKKLAMADSQFGLGVHGPLQNSRIVADTNDAAWDIDIPMVGIGLELTIFFDGVNP